MTKNRTLEERARAFATKAHGSINQLRKYTNEPYIVHPIEVAEIVRGVPHTPEMIAAAYLHDVVEDTDVTNDEITIEFGPKVGTLVEELTDCVPSEGNRAQRKLKDRARIMKASAEAQTIKLADLISNTRSICAHDPGFAKVYMDEKRELLKYLTKGDYTLWREASKIVEKYFKRQEE